MVLFQRTGNPGNTSISLCLKKKKMQEMKQDILNCIGVPNRDLYPLLIMNLHFSPDIFDTSLSTIPLMCFTH